jgi:DNA-binding CsgD family transcriptional regulator
MAIHSPLIGRDEELRTLDRLLEDVRAGQSKALVLRGEPGVGKTALLEYAAESASEFRVTRAVGMESEIELAYAALHQLCAPILDRAERLPGPQRDALGVTFGLKAGVAPDRFLVGLAGLTLLSEAADERPLLCIVDDAQWLDNASAQVLGFVSRRLFAESVAVMFAAREPSGEEPLAGLPVLAVEGLDDGDARALLGRAIAGRLDERVVDRIVAETRGNPLALLELTRGLSAAELAAGFGLSGTLPLPARVEQSFLRRVRPLPDETQLLLLVAAAEPVGDPILLWRAAERFGIGVDAGAPAAAAGLIEFGSRVHFYHPLVRSAIYQAASPQGRRSVHRALAEATDPAVDPDRAAWHRAQATAGRAEDVASELERAAGRARARGGGGAAAVFLERAAQLTAEPARRGERALAAAQAKHEAGASAGALALLATAVAGPLDEFERARVDVLRAQIAFASTRGSQAPRLLLKAAKRFEPLDLSLARETYLEALSAAIFAGRMAEGGVLGVAQAARAASPPSRPPTAVDLLLDGQALLITDGYAAATPVLRQALSAVRNQDISPEEEIRWLRHATRIAIDVWDDENWYVLSARHVQLARDAGALTVLPFALTLHATINVHAGQFAAAAALIEEARGVSAATGNPDVSYSDLILTAWRGQQQAPALIEASARDAEARGEGQAIGFGEYAAAVFYNGIGRYQDALAAADRAAGHSEELWSTVVLPDLIEAATRSDEAEHATDALRRLAAAARASDTDWAVGIAARSRALLSNGEAADRLYREAIDRLGRTRVRTDLARAHLVYGEWLRRERRRLDARQQLRAAHEMFASMGAEGFAGRAARELVATGEKARTRSVDTTGELTGQEARIARMARDGASNQEIATQLFISHKTVQFHLHKVYAKLGISTRNQLHRVLPRD